MIALEEKVLAKKPYKLRHYSLKMASGATPTIVEVSKYYADRETGVPFIRVQNLNETGLLSLDDLKYINQETHANYLKRSQVHEDDLLVKITGVGRMAVAGVPPKGFEGNINQHIVVVKTENRETSEVLAAYLNSNVGEKLASRRSTGGTRPALDYPALKSIPIIYDNRIVELSQLARKRKENQENDAKAVLSEIDSFLCKSLNIKFPEFHYHDINNRIFKRKWKDVRGNRFDPFYQQPLFEIHEQAILNSTYKTLKLKEICFPVRGVTYSKKDEREIGHKILRANNIDLLSNELNLQDIRQIDINIPLPSFQKLKTNDILMSAASGSKDHVGKVAFIDHDMDFYFGGFMMVLRTKNNIHPRYLFEFLQSRIFRNVLFRILGGTNINNLNFSMVRNLPIPMPDYKIQKDIAEYLFTVRLHYNKLIEEAKLDFEKSKKEIENLILE